MRSTKNVNLHPQLSLAEEKKDWISQQNLRARELYLSAKAISVNWLTDRLRTVLYSESPIVMAKVDTPKDRE